MAEIFNTQPKLGIVIVDDGETMHNSLPVIGVRIVDEGVMFSDNQRTLGVSDDVSGTIWNDQPVRGVVVIEDARELYNGQRIVPVFGLSVALPVFMFSTGRSGSAMIDGVDHWVYATTSNTGFSVSGPVADVKYFMIGGGGHGGVDPHIHGDVGAGIVGENKSGTMNFQDGSYDVAIGVGGYNDGGTLIAGSATLLSKADGEDLEELLDASGGTSGEFGGTSLYSIPPVLVPWVPLEDKYFGGEGHNGNEWYPWTHRGAGGVGALQTPGYPGIGGAFAIAFPKANAGINML